MIPIDPESCAKVFARLEDWVDRELSSDDLGRIEQHLRSCAMCASEFRFEEEVTRAVRDRAQRIRLPAGLHQRLREVLAGAAPEPPEPPAE